MGANNCSTRGALDRQRPAFTLIEILAVTILMTCAVALVTVNMHGVSDAARLDAAMTQVASFDALLRTQALAEGAPRMLTFAPEAGVVEVQRLLLNETGVRWSAPSTLRWVAGVTIRDCAPRASRDTDASSDGDANACTVRVHGDGTSASYALRLGIGEINRVLVIDGRTGLARVPDELMDASEDLTDLLEDWDPCVGLAYVEVSAHAP